MAATDLERLVVQLSADVRGFERAMARASGVSNRQFNQIERRARQFNSNLDGIGRRAANSFIAPLAGIGAALGTRELIRLADVWTDLTSRVNLAAGSIQAGEVVMERLGEVARRTYSSLEQTAEGYLLNSTALRELGYSTEQTLDYVEAVNNALVISGARGQRAASVTDALSKALALGELRGDNLNTVIQSGGRLAEALAAGLGVTTNELRRLGQEGGIKTRDVIRALSTEMERLRVEADSLPGTITDGFILLNNALLQYVGNADSATGVSASIASALTMIADNFDDVADAGLRVAAIFAAGLLGRSVLSLVRTLGLGSAALVNFTRALTAARTVASLQVALGGLAAAAGPAGLVIGGGLATALIVAQANAQSAEERTARLNAEFERLGLRGAQAAEGVDQTAEALDRAADEKRVQILRDVSDELDRIRGYGFTNPLAALFGGATDEALEYRNIIRAAGNQLVGGPSADSAAYRQILDLAAAVNEQRVATDEALASARAFAQTDLSEPVRRLNDEFIKTLEYNRELSAVQFANGDTSGIDAVIAALDELRARIDGSAEADFISEEQHQQLAQVIDELKETGDVSEETRATLARLGNVGFAANIIGEINAIIPRLQVLTQEALTAAAAVSQAAPDQGLFDRAGRVQTGQEEAANRKAATAFEQAAARRNALSRTELALETEIAKVRKDSADAGIRLSEEQARRIAQGNLDAGARRTAEGRGGGGRSTKERADEYERLAQRISESTAALVAETEAQRLIDPLVDDYGYTLERTRTEQELLNAAKQAGLEITPELRSQIEALAHQYATASVESAKLAEEQDNIRKAAEEFRDFGKDVFSGFINDLRQGKSAAEALEGALGKVADKLLDLAINSLFGGFNPLSFLGFKDGGPVRGYATGGRVSGPGGPRDDKILARLSNGEFVVNARATAQNRELLEAINSGRIKAFADGGVVSGPPILPRVQTASSQPRTGSNYAPVYNIDARGADAGAVARLEAGLKERDRNFGSMVDDRVDTRQFRRTRA